jgi:AbrB family looped-hinge helix DNA binding protein
MGINMGEATIDERGRIVIPNQAREELQLRPDQRLRISTRGEELVLTPEVGLDEFISGLRGCVHGSKIKPEALKAVWGVDHPHH